MIFLSGLIPAQMKALEYRQVYYEVLAVYLVPEYRDGAFKESPAWPEMDGPARPWNLEGRYLWSFSLCNGKSNATGKAKVEKGAEVTCAFYEMHLWKLSNVNGEIRAGLCALSEMNDVNQTLDYKGKPLHAEAAAALAAIKEYTANIVQRGGALPDAFAEGRRHFLTQKMLLSGTDPAGTPYRESAEAELAAMA